MAMKSVNVSELKNHLSEYLGIVRKGRSILVRDRDRVIARIEPAGDREDASTDEAGWLDALERKGIIRRGKRAPVAALLLARETVRADVVATLIDEREDGR